LPFLRYVASARSIADAARRLSDFPPARSRASWLFPATSSAILRGTPTAITVFGTGVYLVQDKAVLDGVVVQEVAALVGAWFEGATGRCSATKAIRSRHSRTGSMTIRAAAMVPARSRSPC
jgi:hypothetical protein